MGRLRDVSFSFSFHPVDVFEGSQPEPQWQSGFLFPLPFLATKKSECLYLPIRFWEAVVSNAEDGFFSIGGLGTGQAVCVPCSVLRDWIFPCCRAAQAVDGHIKYQVHRFLEFYVNLGLIFVVRILFFDPAIF